MTRPRALDQYRAQPCRVEDAAALEKIEAGE